MVLVGPANIPDVTAATAAFSASVTDPKAGLITAYNYGFVSMLPKIRNRSTDSLLISLKYLSCSSTMLPPRPQGSLTPSWQFLPF